MLLAVTVFAVPMFLSLNVAVPDTVKTSPDTRLSKYDTVAAVFALYTRLVAVIVTVRERKLIAAVVVGAPEVLSE